LPVESSHLPTDAQPTRIAFCITDLDAGGAERALVQIVTRLNRRRFEPFVFCLSGEGELSHVLRDAGVAVVCLGAQKRHGLSVVWQLSRRLAKLKPALLQTFLYHANIVGRVAGKAARIPVIVSGIRVAEKRSGFRLWLDRATGWMVARHVCVSEDVAAFSAARGRLPVSKICVIPNGIDAAKVAEAAPADLTQFGIPAGSRTLLFVGRLDPQKGPFVLMAAVRELCPRHADLQALIVGDGPLRNTLQAWVAKENLASRVHFAGRRNDVPSLLRAADLFVLPSLWEGLPNVVLEAMAAGTPIVASRVEGISDLLVDDRTGLIVPPNSAGDLAEAIDRLLADQEHARKMGYSAQHFVRERFTWDHVIAQYEQLYTDLLISEGQKI
jgi:glycosyltransferase involved in cell wall biosynthesis